MTVWHLRQPQHRPVGTPIRPWVALLLCLSGLVLLPGCASYGRVLQSPPPLLGHDIPEIPEPNFTVPSQEMLDFLDQYVDLKRGKEQAVWSLVWATTDPYVLRFDYRPELTLPPVETFNRHTGNCLSYSAMFMMMARHLGLKAYYQEVEIPQTWTSDNDTLLVSMHVNVAVDAPMGGSWVVDVSGRSDVRSRLQRRISDNVVLAQYYNNLGADALADGDLGMAYAYMSKAIATEPELHYLWSNLGVVYSRNEQIDDATNAYLTALGIDSSSSMAANNLYLIYEKTGNLAAAAELQKRVDRNRRKNPYYLSYLASLALEEGRLDESRQLTEKALELQGNEFRFHYQLALTLVREGKRNEAEASLQRALELAPDDLPSEWLSSMYQLEQLPELASDP
ncbi:MAG TPA: tetratricopeptide repeat protein [Xanthomonadales bacterium]|nr:tetratricopeptide repeat protein [Xanthomonadales bacterium]